MKFFKLVLVALLICTSCTSSRKVVGNSKVATKKMSARKVSKKHLETSFHKNTLEARLKVAFQDNKNNATYMGVIVARAKITPDSVNYYEKINRTYFKGSFEVLENILGAEVNFKQLQNLLLGEAIYDLKAKKYKAVVDNNAHLLLPVQQKALFDILFWINPTHYKLDGQALKNTRKNQELKIGYKSYSKIDGEVFPKKIEIRAKERLRFTNIDIEYRSVVFNKKFSTPFKVPNGYKQVVL